MSAARIMITESDKSRLMRLLDEVTAQSVRPDEEFNAFRRKLNRAQVVPSEEIPDDIVTMNSKIEMYDGDFDITEVYTLVYPRDANASLNRLSILNPLGMTILGRRQGDVARWYNASGEHQLTLMTLTFQPERDGVMNL